MTIRLMLAVVLIWVASFLAHASMLMLHASARVRGAKVPPFPVKVI